VDEVFTPYSSFDQNVKKHGTKATWDLAVTRTAYQFAKTANLTGRRLSFESGSDLTSASGLPLWSVRLSMKYVGKADTS
jgi:hypothetical protein